MTEPKIRENVDEALILAAINFVQAREITLPIAEQERRFLVLAEAVGKRLARDLLAVQTVCQSPWPLL